MPAHDHDRKVREEAQFFCRTKSHYPQPCLAHEPTLDELKATTFSDFVRHVVLKQARRREYEGDEDKKTSTAELITSKLPIPYLHGMAKVTLPQGFWDQESIGKDPTARGPKWETGTRLGDMEIPSPIKQCIRGIGGIYEYTFLDLPPITVSEFRKKADEYFTQQVAGNASDLSIDMLERKFWKRLGPTMQPNWYGADMEGTLFGDEECYGWNISKLHSCLQLLLSDQPDNKSGGIPGVTTPYLYFGMWATVFCAHTEDMNLLSINYLHAGAPKVWYAIAAGEDAKRFEQLCEGHYHQAKSGCTEYLRHKRVLVSPHILKKAGIPFTKMVQNPGDAMITFPGGYHFGFNTGFNVAEATNFAVPEWIAYGKRANVCLCRPDSVRIDMNKMTRLMEQYQKQRRKESRRVLWKDWAQQVAKKKNQEQESPRRSKSSKAKKEGEEAEAKQQVKKDFWVEVMQPVAVKAKKAKQTKSRKRLTKEHEGEVWRLAKPVGRKLLKPLTRVLCIVPAIVEGNQEDDEDEEDEQCFAGAVTEVTDDHVRVHFDGLPKKDDLWMSMQSPKLFLDGGLFGEAKGPDSLLPRHYWKEEDSKRRCV
jgi:hypothetical protein